MFLHKIATPAIAQQPLHNRTGRSTAGFSSLLALLAGAASWSLTATADPLADAIHGGKASLDVRLRYEYVDQDNNLDQADGLTVRTRLGLQAAPIADFTGFIEFENTAALQEDFNSGPGGNGETDFSVIADPDNSEVNRATISYGGIADTQLIAGRQRIIYDSARFVGNVGWRQNEQTFDAFRLVNSSVGNLTLNYAYLNRIKDIFGESIDTNSHLANLSYQASPMAKLTLYGYFIDFNKSALEATSSQTLGGSLEGAIPVADAKLLYLAEYAQQSDFAEGNNQIDADYLHLMLGANVAGVVAKIGYELLGDDDFSGFETPLATKHAFNGWADLFLNTPTDGLADTYASLAGSVRDVKLVAAYHDFGADKGSADYGTEVDLMASMQFASRYTVGIKTAFYDADDFSTDTRKVWLWTDMTF